MNHKYRNPEKAKCAKGGEVGRAAERFSNKEMYLLFKMLLLMTLLLQCLNNNGEAKVVHRSEKTLKLLQSSSSLIQLRHKRDTFANENLQQQQQGQEAFVRDGINYYENPDAKDDADDDDSDNNYDVLPDMFASYQPPSVGDQISETAKRVAQSFTNMWQSLTDFIRHCLAGLRAMFGDDAGFGEEDLTPEQAEQLRIAMDHQHDNEVFWDVYENKL